MKVYLVLSEAEADAMKYALGNSTDAPDVMVELFPEAPERDAAYRAVAKLDEAIVDATAHPMNRWTRKEKRHKSFTEGDGFKATFCGKWLAPSKIDNTYTTCKVCKAGYQRWIREKHR